MNKVIQQNKRAYPCPECENPIPVKEMPKAGLFIECPACGTESEFISADPPQLAPLEEEK
ncbi:hypothetical protein A3D05_02765 [Candidatus Gottesmanbacteria bacterium RIFCSPHIGHO2_02_FULL_40_24]|uniref:Lysine biosynthesis protein LysW n=1 Tax=Candidatus Gottesmanbacteria bacterium RIFCSPHIGHO2_01_FULL_40_15 TaxID=1798376 RepID=A0A1F5Z773_9BACT|nr:MAG: hypothetical protein A2777_06270 [Candidatus Gottesmanbacteria bacterium RIFCSPHIGHO2_01_FULL_40_15]OGG18109.1 MAG: hypothetical protein A3D05_02765 [Candidatus Gottesmanbacteria bacterium RIFCSPHIGHO2_02_FULL_40_24]OGG21029.1 MAG: hypothetical protein A3B48_03755 [Candidatus Gottesmanbacteria bacterium RIFCSPLOWO2_01_FULL_40_10]OGG25052.1 MAG: hypothetical protein A3E42_05150 [Candidatus Gottesmanbacteria bacterium RIFCSPHIGHO2_12_FULL_40_13]OGG33879.1 MAG: hypothetical protein A3I80_0